MASLGLLKEDILLFKAIYWPLPYSYPLSELLMISQICKCNAMLPAEAELSVACSKGDMRTIISNHFVQIITYLLMHQRQLKTLQTQIN